MYEGRGVRHYKFVAHIKTIRAISLIIWEEEGELLADINRTFSVNSLLWERFLFLIVITLANPAILMEHFK